MERREKSGNRIAVCFASGYTILQKEILAERDCRKSSGDSDGEDDRRIKK